MPLHSAATAAGHSRTANSTVVNAYHRLVVDLLLGISENLETTLRHASLTFHARGEALETARLRLVRHILTRLRPLLQHHLSAAASVAVAVGVISNFAVAAVAEEILTTATCSEETARLQCHDGPGTRERFLARLARFARFANQKGGTNDASTGEMRNVDLNGPIESVMSNAQEEIHRSLVLRTERPMIRWRVEPHTRRQHHT